jgi:NADH:ubiquinone reductase (H+-translocating)
MSAHHVVIVGAGFAGLKLAQDLRGAPVRITIVDQRNHHLFQPLLYQVATTLLATSEIAWPIRRLFRDRPEVTTLLGQVAGVDRGARLVLLRDGGSIPYDTLVLATGARHAYFGHDEWEPNAPGLKTLEDATTIRRRLLLAFERAERETDPEARRALMTFCVIGGGPTGVELTGIIAELAQHTLLREFRNIDTRETRVVLVEAGSRVLPAFSPELSAYATAALARLGAEVRCGAPVTACDATGIRIGDAFVPARTVIWAAGVQASEAAHWLDAPADRAGRVMVAPDLTVPGTTDVFAIGDTAHVEIEGAPVPGVAPAAKQQGAYVARVIRARLAGRPAPAPFTYRHLGNLATVGRSEAVIDFGRAKLTGWLAWWIWGIAHIYFLIGTRSRLTVAISWLWAFLMKHNSARLITQKETLRAEVSDHEATAATAAAPPAPEGGRADAPEVSSANPLEARGGGRV